MKSEDTRKKCGTPHFFLSKPICFHQFLPYANVSAEFCDDKPIFKWNFVIILSFSLGIL